MLLSSSSLFNLPTPPPHHHLKPQFLNASFSFSISQPLLPSLSASASFPSPSSSSSSSFTILAMKRLQGRVVKNQNDKTVAVEVVRLAPHPKYKRRVRIKKRYQAHDPDNVFQVGDTVQLEKIRPISKTKTFLALPVAARNAPKSVESVPAELRESATVQAEEDDKEHDGRRSAMSGIPKNINRNLNLLENISSVTMSEDSHRQCSLRNFINL